MKLLLAIIISASTLQPVAAQDSAIMQKKVSVIADNAEISNVLDDISRKSGVNFSYNSDLLKNQKVSLNRQDCELETILNTILADNISYTVIGGNIVIYEKTELPAEKPQMIKVSGVVRDADQNNALPFASISLNNTALGTITNENGKFDLLINPGNQNDTLVVSYLGYSPKKIAINQLVKSQSNNIALSQHIYGLGEVLVTPVETEKIIRESVSRIHSQYYRKANVYKAFYRESYYADSSFAARDEAMLNIYKSGGSDVGKNKMAVTEGRKMMSRKQYDILLKLRGGPFNIIELDFVNRGKEFISTYAPKYYDFQYVGKDSTDQGVFLVIQFDKKSNAPGIKYSGKMFIEKTSKSIARLEFEITPDGKKLTAKNRKGETVDMVFRRMAYHVNYTPIDGKWYLQSCIGEETRQITDKNGKDSYITSIQQLIITESSGSDIFPKEGTLITRKDLLSDVIVRHNANLKKEAAQQ
ncbi:MAG: carboxypeptidase-like regulatory domain-containing protein [Bacteroidales bacterium]|nr:carboxypeptidase-like regulatory domain-containing protein [Bacteroidales bacterium]